MPSLSKAESYRGRETSEIIGEQIELERLKRQAKFNEHPYWEWSYDAGEFMSTQRWVEMLGQIADPVFPEWEINQAITHEDLVNFIDRWMSAVVETDKVEAGDRAREFLLAKPVSKEFDHSYSLRHADGSAVPVRTKARSIWRDKKLIALFSETRSLGEIIGREAEAISESADKINTLNSQLKTLGGKVINIKKWWPFLLAGTVLFNDGVELLFNQGQRAYDLIVLPIQSARTSSRNKLLPSWAGDAEIAKALNVMRPYGKLGDVTLWIYDPGDFPTEYAPIAKVSPNEIVRFAEGTSSYNAYANEEIQTMVKGHQQGRTYELIEDEGFLVSVPFTVLRRDGRSQVFFIELVAGGTVKLSEGKDSMVKLKNELTEVFAEP